MIEAPNHPPGTAERKVELDQSVDFAVQLLVEEAALVGWQRVEFLTAVADAANTRIAVIAKEFDLDEDRERLGTAPGVSV